MEGPVDMGGSPNPDVGMVTTQETLGVSVENVGTVFFLSTRRRYSWYR